MFMLNAIRAVLTLGALVVLSSVQAQPATDARRVAAEIVEISMGDALFQGVRANTGQMLAGLPKQMGLSDKLNTKQQAIMERFMRETLDSVLSPEFLTSMRVAYADAFAAVYTIDELQTILAFYRSPTGAAMVRKMPDAMRIATPQVQAMMVPLMKRIQDRSAALAEELKAAQ